MSTAPTRKKRKILFLAANPENSVPLRLNEEFRDIEEGLTRAKLRSKFQLVSPQLALRPRDLVRAVTENEPQIIHFSGHGLGDEGLALEDETGQAKLVSTGALENLFKLLAEETEVECVLLNACYSQVQANAIAKHIPYVIGMNRAIGDGAALEFAVGFYDALGRGKDIGSAHKWGCSSIGISGFSETLTPVLIQRTSLSQEASLPRSTSESTVEEQRNSERKLTNISEQDPGFASRKEVYTTPSTYELPLLEEPEGQIPLDSPFYMERPPIEVRCYETIVKPGALIRIKAPRQMGKSSLMLRILSHAAENCHRAVILSFQFAGEEAFSSLDTFLNWFCSRITRKLNLPNKLQDYWQGALGSNDKCTDYFELYLLPEIDGPVTLCLDEVDEVFKHPTIASDFFGLLRAWHEESKINPVWRNLRLVITHSKEVYIPLNINQSPFNVGVPIELPQLNPYQIKELVQRHGLSWRHSEIEHLMALVGGHPFLVRVALYHISRREITLERLMEVAPTEEWKYGEHLRRHLLNLEDDQELLAAIKHVVAANTPIMIGTAEAFKLSSMGLVRFRGNDVEPLCDLYRQYFRERLGVS